MKSPAYLCIPLALSALLSSALADPKGEAVAKSYFSLKEPVSSVAQATMVLIDKSGKQRSRSLTLCGKKDGAGSWSFIEFSAPADIKGTRFLTIPHASGDDEQRLYLPALGKTRIISSASRDGKFVGSEFTYYDLEDRSFEDYTYSYLREEKLQNRTCDVIGMVAKDPAAPYGRAEAWVDKADHFVYQTRLYDKASGQHRKTLAIVETKTIDGCIIPTKLVMENLREGTKTLLALSEVQINKPLDSGLFSIQNLEKK